MNMMRWLVLATRGGNHTVTTIYDLNDDLLRLSQALLGIGHFQYHNIACKMLLRASKVNLGYRNITTGESVTSSIECSHKYFEDEGTGKDHQLQFFWYSAARSGHVDRYLATCYQEQYWGGVLLMFSSVKPSLDNLMLCSG